MFHLFYVFLLIPLVCFALDTKQDVHFAATRAFRFSNLNFPIKMLINADFAKKWAFKKSNPIMPIVHSMKSKHPQQLLLTYAKLVEAPDVPKIPEMQMMDAYYLKADLKEHPQNVESRIHLKTDKPLVVELKNNEIKQKRPQSEYSQSNLRLINTLKNTLLEVNIAEASMKEFNDKVQANAKKIEEEPLIIAFNDYFASFKTKKRTFKLQKKLNKALQISPNKPSLLFFDSTPNNTTGLNIIDSKTFKSLGLAYRVQVGDYKEKIKI